MSPFLDFGPSHISNWQTCENFAQLAKRGYYNGVVFHRIVVVRPPYPKLSYLCSSSLEGFYGPGRRPDWDGQRRHQHIRSKVVRRTSSSVAHRTNDSPTHPSEDEIHPELRFTGAGILAMANSGPNTNGSFRFVSFRAHPTPSSSHHKALTSCTHFWLSRFAVLYDSGPDAIFG